MKTPNDKRRMEKLIAVTNERDALREERDNLREELTTTKNLFKMLGREARGRADEIKHLRASRTHLGKKLDKALADLAEMQEGSEHDNETIQQLEAQRRLAVRHNRELTEERDNLLAHRDELLRETMGVGV